MTEQIEQAINQNSNSKSKHQLKYTPSPMLEALMPMPAGDRLVKQDKYISIKEQWLLERYLLHK